MLANNRFEGSNQLSHRDIQWQMGTSAMLNDGRPVAAPAAPAVIDDAISASLSDGVASVLTLAAFRSCTAYKHNAMFNAWETLILEESQRSTELGACVKGTLVHEALL